ncbi:hypothetical protein [Priestia megaterium]
MKYSIKNDYKSIHSVAIIPVKDLKISEKYCVNNISIYPVNTVDKEELKGNKIDFDFLNIQEEFYDSALIVFPIEHFRKNILGSLTPRERNRVLDRSFEKADDVLNVFRYIYSNFDKASNLSQKAGYINSIYSGLLIFYPELYTFDFVKEKYKMNNQILGQGLFINQQEHKETLDKHFSIFKEDCGEVGNILKHSLRLYSNIVQSNNLTNKFMQAMSLIEYLANPFEYEKMQVAKTKLLPFTANNRQVYHELCERFKLLTSLKDEKGKQIGLRTNIVHNGRTLEEMLEKDYEGNLLIRELQLYVCNYIEKAFDYYQEEWDYFVNIRELRFKQMNSKKQDIRVKDTGDVMILIDFEFFNKSLKETYQLYPQYKYKKFNVINFLYFLLNQVDIDREGYQIPVQIVIKDNEPIYNCSDNRNIKEFENLGFNCDKGEFDIYVTETQGDYYSSLESFLRSYSQEKNHVLTPSSKFDNIIFISDRNEINHQLFRSIEQSVKKVYLGRLDNKRTTNFPESTWFDIQYLYMDCIGIDSSEECDGELIYDVLPN